MSGFRMEELTSVVGDGCANKGPIPSRMRRWNWGAFVFTWIWASQHGISTGWIVVMVLLSLGPPLNLVQAVYMGLMGNRMAWRFRHFAGSEEFEQTERSWGRAALAVFALVAALLCTGWIRAQDVAALLGRVSG